MATDAQLAAAAALLALGVGCIALSAVLVYCSTRARALRAAELAAVGAASIVLTSVAMGLPDAGVLWSELVWPLLVTGAAFAAGAGAATALVYLVSSTR